MKLLLIFMFGMVNLVIAQDDTSKFVQRTVSFPKTAIQVLNKRFPDWNLCVHQFDAYSKKETDLITGDFDGNRAMDFAALIKTNKESYLIALLQISQTYKIYILDTTKCEPDLCVTLSKKGGTTWDVRTGIEYTLDTDAIGFGSTEKNDAGTYCYIDGKFRYFAHTGE